MAKTVITSFQNPKLKKIVQLREHKTRQSTGLTIVEGFREISRLNEAHKAGALLKELFICREFLKDNGKEDFVKTIEAQGVSIFEVSKEVYAKISFGDRLEGMLAVCQPRVFSLEDLPLRKIPLMGLLQNDRRGLFRNSPLIVVVEGWEKPGNLGAILRTCDAAGVDGLIVGDGQTDIYNPNVIRASLGTVFSVRVVQSTKKETLKFLKDRNMQICAATPEATKTYFETNFKVPAALVLGSEEKGLSDFWLEAADCQIKIPMHGKADSLNVSTTAGILIYEALRQRII